MTTELEKDNLTKTFFDTFGIEPDTSEVAYFTGNMGYPEITDRHYLKMLAFLTCCDDKEYGYKTLSELRKTILEDIIDRYGFETRIQNDYSMKEIIQELFKGE